MLKENFAQQIFTSLKSTIKLLVKRVKKGSELIRKTLTHVNVVVLVSLLLTLNIFHTFFSVSIASLEHVFVAGERKVLNSLFL